MFRTFLNRPIFARSFSVSRTTLINIGETLPKIPVFETSPGNKLSLIDEIKGKSLLVGVPGAFSPGCSANHIPGYIKNLENFKNKGIKEIFVISVNDPFVTNAWKKDLSAPEEIRFIADSTGDFTEELDLHFDATPIFGNSRSKRYAVVIDEQGKVENLFVEPDNVSVSVSSAESVIEKI